MYILRLSGIIKIFYILISNLYTNGHRWLVVILFKHFTDKVRFICEIHQEVGPPPYYWLVFCPLHISVGTASRVQVLFINWASKIAALPYSAKPDIFLGQIPLWPNSGPYHWQASTDSTLCYQSSNSFPWSEGCTVYFHIPNHTFTLWNLEFVKLQQLFKQRKKGKRRSSTPLSRHFPNGIMPPMPGSSEHTGKLRTSLSLIFN